MIAYIWLILGLTVLVMSGNWLVTGSVQLARYFKISSLVVGLTVVAYGTSAPEMFISVGAALDGAHDIALGNVIGSNIANIGCILAIVALIYPIVIRNKAIAFDLMIMFVVTTLLLVFGLNGVIGFWEGVCFVGILVGYTVWSVVKSRMNFSSEETEKVTMKPILAVLLILVSIVGLYFGSGWFVLGAREIALQWGVSERVIAISVVAIGTSFPELMTSLVAAIRKEADLSIGNIIGSNIFNIAGVLGVTSIIRSLNIGDLSMFFFDMKWVFGISLALVLCMLPLSRGKISRLKGGLLLLSFMIYILILYR